MSALISFASQFGAKIMLNPEFIVENAQRYYFINPSLRKLARRDFYYAGLYLGKVKKGVFFPSFNLLNMLVAAAANKVILDRKTAWLYICGRDVFRTGILKMTGSKRKGDATLVLNEFGECLGFGRIMGQIDESGKNDIIIKNVSDVGDFLRRER
jgi:ribosome biogenesis protein Nip4